jgi:N-acetylglutamate synthase-like GNAT family acetyltransferase
MNIKQAATQKEKKDLDRLLWTVLWKPLKLPRHIRDSFKLETPQIELIAMDDKVMAGVLVANWLSEKEIEIRHIAVKEEYQNASIGTGLVKALFDLLKEKAPVQVQTIARNTSSGFFTKLGFKAVGNRFNHPKFREEGIWLQQMNVVVKK